VRIDALDIDEHILEKIETKHGLRWDEVEDACFSPRRHLRQGRDGTMRIFSQTSAGRYLLVVLVPRSGGVWKVVTARDMALSERRLYQQVRR